MFSDAASTCTYRYGRTQPGIEEAGAEEAAGDGKADMIEEGAEQAGDGKADVIEEAGAQHGDGADMKEEAVPEAGDGQADMQRMQDRGPRQNQHMKHIIPQRLHRNKQHVS